MDLEAGLCEQQYREGKKGKLVTHLKELVLILESVESYNEYPLIQIQLTDVEFDKNNKSFLGL
jgi:hypothetical protein